MNPRRRIVAFAVLLPTLVLGVPPAAASADTNELGVVTVLRQPAGGAVSVVADVQPTPPAPLPADAAQVTVAGATVPATTAPLLDAAAPTAIVLDASSGGSNALPQALSGTAGFLFRLPSTVPVTAIADTTPPRNLTPSPVNPVDALQLVAGVRAGGARSTSAALDLALKGLPHKAGVRSLLLLQTTGSAPQDAAGLSDRFRSAGVVLAVVTTTKLAAGWTPVARATGGLAVEAAPRDLATAFDAVPQTLQGRSVVTFTPPAGATSASLRLRAGGGVLPAEVSLASSTPAASRETPAGSLGGTTPTSSGGFSWLIAGLVAAVVLLALAAAALISRRGRPSRGLPAGREPRVDVLARLGASEGAAEVAAGTGERPPEQVESEGDAEEVAGEGDERPVEVLEGEVVERERVAEEVAGEGDERPVEVLEGEVVEGEVVEGEGPREDTGEEDQSSAAEVPAAASEGGAEEIAAADGDRPAEVPVGAGEAPVEVGGDAPEQIFREQEPPVEVPADAGDESAAPEVAGDGERSAHVRQGAVEAVAAEDGERPTEVPAGAVEAPVEVGGDAPEQIAQEQEPPAEVPASVGEGAVEEIAADGERSAEVPAGAGEAPVEVGGDAVEAVAAGDGQHPVEVAEGAPEEVAAGDGGERSAEVPAEVPVGAGEGTGEQVAGDGARPAAPDVPRQQESAAPPADDGASSESDVEEPPRVRVFDVTNPDLPVEIKSPQPAEPQEGAEYVGQHRKGRHRPRLRLKLRQEDEPSSPDQRDRSA